MFVAGAASPSGAGSEFEPDEIDVKAVAVLIARRVALLVDVRTAEEFAVSHLRGAIRIDPEASAGHALALLGQRVKSAEIVLYCTGGPRSMGLGINIRDNLLHAGAMGVHVMKDGIIAWANANYRLVDQRGRTRFVHPSDQASRGRLADPNRARFVPRL